LLRRLVREAGSDGLTAQQLAQQLPLPQSAVDAEALLITALRHGLVRRLGGYLGWSYAAAEHSHRFLAAGGLLEILSRPVSHPSPLLFNPAFQHLKYSSVGCSRARLASVC